MTQSGSVTGAPRRVFGLKKLDLPGMTRLMVLFLLLAAPIFGQIPPSDRVSDPSPGAIAIRWYESGSVLWIATQTWALAVLALLMFTGLSAKMRNWANRAGRQWPLRIAAYLIMFSLFMMIVNLPLSYFAGYVRPHAYGLSNQSVGRWFGNVLKSLVIPNTQFPPFQVPGLVFGFLFVLLLYSLLRKSPQRWWLYAGMALMPLIFFGALIKPVWMDPLSHQYGPLKDKAIESSILELAQHAGIDGGRVFEVNMSRDTKTMDANVSGFLGTERIVVWDTTIAGLEKRELLTVLAHEMGHYVLGHAPIRILVQSLLLLAALGFVRAVARPLINKYKKQFGFDSMDDIASLPLIFLLLNVAILLLLPADFAFLRHQEHEADRFALELTRDNHGAATAFVKLTQGVLGVPRHGWLYTAWRDTHPSLGDRLDFFNNYRPWQTGQPLKYGHFFETTQ
jgi:STE24 endopeptidase